jgi:hypothetical protein
MTIAAAATLASTLVLLRRLGFISATQQRYCGFIA